MSDEELMLKAVLADPDDDTARGAYADAVQERDEARAALVRSRLPCLACRATGSMGALFIGIVDVGAEPLAPDRSACHWCTGSGWVPFCQEEGCRNAGRRCVLQDTNPEGTEDTVEFFCGQHAARHGYCPGCGAFWGGVGTFEASGLCDHCADGLHADYAEERQWEDDEYRERWEDDFEP